MAAARAALDLGEGPAALPRAANGSAGIIGAWTNITSTAGAPSPARGHEPMVYDPAIQAVVLFGGYDPVYNQALNDTWVFTNGTWVNVTGSLHGSAPPRTYGAAMA
ncbi:MAG TPA: kelch repeat-containing protein, partial [Thermoplasmata archaeon]|nr:kelch repeat-containing protein [Thermoplasmata archaeon]